MIHEAQNDVVCPDKHSTCPTGTTCCALAGGAYGCCPMPNAVCCSDHVHCCPSGYTCDVQHSQCLKHSTLDTLPLSRKFPAVIKNQQLLSETMNNEQRREGESRNANEVCPDKSVCPAQSTCCKLTTGEYGCCPMPNAVCCSDHLHYCANGYTCDLVHSRCLRQGTSETMPLSRKFPAITVEQQKNSESEENVGERENPNFDVICPDQKSHCPAGSTCCPLDGRDSRRMKFLRAAMVTQSGKQSTRYGCCPAVQAVCCSDHLHCCPHGTTCDLQEGRCVQSGIEEENSNSNEHQPMLTHSHHSKKNKAADSSTTKPTGKICNGGGAGKKASICPITNKCCRHRNSIDGRKWNACCPFVNGQCCAHSGHCCPAGFACAAPGDENQRCISEQNSGVTLSTRMFPTTDVSYQKTSKFNCCQDGENLVCCPHGYKCKQNDRENREVQCERMNFLELAAHVFLSKD